MKKKLIVGIGVIAVGVGVVWLNKPSNVEKFKVEGGQAAQSSPGTRNDLNVDAVSSPRFDPGAERGAQAVTPAKTASTQLSDAVKALLGLDGGEHDYNSLEAAIHELSKELSADDVAALRDMLTWPNDRFPEGMRAIEINAVKNDVLDRILRQTELPEGIGLQMVEMASNVDNDPVWRDYCIQFMQPFYERRSKVESLNVEGVSQASSLPSDARGLQDAGGTEELEAVRETMFQALEERDSTIAGTSLIGLELLSRTHDEFDRESILSSATEIAADESASASCRLTALRLASERRTTEDTEYTESTAEAARMLAQTGETVLLRSAAIVTLGETGSEEDRELLESFALSDNKQIVAAAELALEKMGREEF